MEKQFELLKESQRVLSNLSEQERNQMLVTIADALVRESERIEASNRVDLESAQKEGLSLPLQKRLILSTEKIKSVAAGVKEVASLKDPIGRIRERRLLDETLLLERVDVPIGVIGMIFESRPDALVQIISLALKSGNGIIVKGGKEALQTNKTVVEVMREALAPFKAGSDWIVHLESRDDVKTLLSLDHIVDLLIPRGSNEFVRYVMENTHIPVLGHADGICAMYIDKEAKLDLAVEVAIDAKCQYPAVCNAIETLLVHSSIASDFLIPFAKEGEKYNLTLHGDKRTQEIIKTLEATEEDYQSEYLDYELAIKIVDSPEEAISHILTYGSSHTDAIITENEKTAQQFLRQVDSADVFWNCSTRFADGFRFGLGAEVGISTQKIHARGPVGLDGLVVSKWLLKGSGETVASFESGQRVFKHLDLPLEGDSIMGKSE